ncbi:MAG: indolepyruvate ferredoxin oxidoreductase subunit alpha [Smithellaceae bacterium]|nr:indolepyruvate ferredoxin oxidoreductase subunit alpha [Smithellaceae bacterium]
MKKLMTGNEAFAYGAYLAGVRVGAAYPGTPSTQIMENYATYPGVFAEWAPNEKVAMDVAIGAAYAGTRSMVSTKHVGMNVSADSLFYAVYTGLNAAFVIGCADDPGMHSSQNEQDSRNYAKFGKVPMLEPADSQEAKDFVAVAAEMSEAYDTPVIVRFVTRTSHSSSVVDYDPAALPPPAPDPKPYKKDLLKFVMIPGHARRRHPVVEERIRKLQELAEVTPLNRIEPGDGELGIVAAGSVYQYAKEVFPDATYLKLGMVYPLPKKLVKEFAGRVKKVLVIEELDPFIEEHLRLQGIEVIGKDIFPLIGEFSPSMIRETAVKAGLLAAAASSSTATPAPAINLPIRPPILCAGCGHRGMYNVLREANVAVMGDIGCYTLGVAYPLEALHFCGCMGASIGVAHGFDKGRSADRHVAVIGDSTFFHSGIHPLIDVLYNQGKTTTIIADNSTTGMTGHQHHPGTGFTLQEAPTVKTDIERLVRGMGFSKVDVCDPYEMDNFRRVLEDHLASDEASVIIVRRPCVLQQKVKLPPPRIDPEECTNCGACLDLGCPPLVQEEGHVRINDLICIGCGLCVQVCPVEAIKSAAV